MCELHQPWNPNIKIYLTNIKEIYHDCSFEINYWETLTLYKITSGLEVKEVPLNSLPATIWGFTIPSFYLIIAFAMYSSCNNDSSGLYEPSLTFWIMSYCLSFCSLVSSAGTNF
jgi:hypothetical protein